VVGAVGVPVGAEVIKHRSYAQKVQEVIGGKATHPVCGLPGGMARVITEDERKKFEAMSKSCVEFAKFTQEVFANVVLKNKDYLDIILNKDIYYQETYNLGTVDKNDKINFYDGTQKMIDPDGNEVARYKDKEYTKYIAEHVLPWSYEKFCYFKPVGWKGLKDGKDSGIYRATPLSRLNVSKGFTTPLAQAEYEKFKGTFRDAGIKGPVHFTMAMHWARVIELLYAAEWMLELSQDPEITDSNIRGKLDTPGEGVGILEAPRGTLTHHYKADENGITTFVNLVVGTTNNNAPINLDVKKSASALIKNWQVSNGLLNMVEMAYRAYDPCNSCATHTLPGQMPMRAIIRRSDGSVYKVLSNF
jgi:F420-non-reducing hydrogenase large subunit